MHRAFTLIELLIVIVIVALLMGLGAPILAKANRSAQQSRMQMDLHSISLALNAYYADFKDFPRPDRLSDASIWRGAVALANALIAPAGRTTDGADGFGFRLRREPGQDMTMGTSDDITQGKVYGPYLSDSFRLTAADGTGHLLDMHGQPILYYVRSVGGVEPYTAPRTYLASVAPPAPLTGDSFPFWNAYDNAAWLTTEQVARIVGANPDGSAPAGKARRDRYFMVAAGYDQKLGTSDDITEWQP